MKLKPLYFAYLIVVTAISCALQLDVFGVQAAICTSFQLEPGSVSGADTMLVAATAPFPYDAARSAIVVAYRNARAIWRRLLPVVRVGKQEFKYGKYDKRETFTIPNTLIGRRSAVPQVMFTRSDETGTCFAHGLSDPVPQEDIDNAPENYDPVNMAIENIAKLLELGQEKRVADLVFSSGSYSASNKTQLSGNDQWNSGESASNPIDDISAGLDACVVRPNIMALGQSTWTGLRQNPYIVKAVNNNAGDSGMASRQQVADLFELDDVVVGMGWYNQSKRGQAASLARLWGKHCALLHVDPDVQTADTVTFGFTAQWGDEMGGAKADSKIGLKGAVVAQAGFYRKEVITANDLGYFIEDAVG